jgi:hypothetical protein
VQERYGLPPEAITYFLLRHQSAKVIHAGSALFLVTFLAIPVSPPPKTSQNMTEKYVTSQDCLHLTKSPEL